MMYGTLVNLEAVKAWLGISLSDHDSDALLRRLIKGASEFALNYMNRNNFGRTDYQNQLLDGFGNPFIVLREYPVIEVTALSIGQKQFHKAIGTPPDNGWWLDDTIQNAPQRLLLLGGATFPRQRSSVMISYSAGYFIKAERHRVPTSGPYKVDPCQFWYSDYAVTLEDGTPLTYLASGNPASMEYTIDADNGTYTFNAAQADQVVLISYSYVPADIAQAVMEIVGERFKSKDRIGYNSKSLGGQETVSFNNQSMSNYARELLNPYRRVF